MQNLDFLKMQGLVAQIHSGEGGLEDTEQMNQKLKGTLQGSADQFPLLRIRKASRQNWRSSHGDIGVRVNLTSSATATTYT